MYQLYKQSVRAAYTVSELQSMLDVSPLANAHVFTHHATHLGIERPIQLQP
jgi:hypothetical protein